MKYGSITQSCNSNVNETLEIVSIELCKPDPLL